MVTLKEIAEMCGVSVATVSNVLNGKAKTSEETRAHILNVVKQTGYQPNYMAKGLRSQKTRTIALIVDEITQFTSAPMIESVMEYFEKRDYRVIMRNLRLYRRWAESWHEQEAAFQAIVKPVIKDVKATQVDGIVYIAGHTRVIQCFEEDFSVPAVMAYAFSNQKKIPSIVLDDMNSAREIMEYLLANGHTRIGFVGGRMDNYHTQQRLMGYQKALFEHGILFDPDLVYYGEWMRETGYEGARYLLEKNVSAIFCCADKMAGGVYDYLEEAGKKVGKDISVTGFDDEDMASYFTPKLTTTKLPLTKIGHKAAELLMEQIDKSKVQEEAAQEEVERIPQVFYIPCEFTIRRSVEAINQ